MSETGYERHLERRLDQSEKDIEILERNVNALERAVERANLLLEQQNDVPSRVHELEVQMVSQNMITGAGKWVVVTLLTTGIAVLFSYVLRDTPM